MLAANGAGVEVGGPPAIIAGHGLGAMVAATAARLQPGSVAGLALVDGGWEDIGVSTRLSQQEFLAAIAEPPEVMASMDAFLADRRDFDPGSWDADQERAFRAQVDQKHAGHVALVTRQAVIRGVVEAMFDYRPVDTLTAATMPLLVFVAGAGTADDETTRERRAGAGRRPGGAPGCRAAGGARGPPAGYRPQPDALPARRGQRGVVDAQRRGAR